MRNKLIEFLDLGLQPLANSFLLKKDLNKKEKKYKLIVCFNKENKLVSIKKTFSSEKTFDNKYPYLSSMSNTAKKSFYKLAEQINKKYKFNQLLEIGSNDGTFIKHFNKNKTVGVEPCSNIEKITKKKKFKTISEYWTKKTAEKILKKSGKFDIVYSANTITHIKDLDKVFKSIKLVLNKKGIIIIEDPSLLDCLKKNTYDQFYNEHIYVFSYLSLSKILKKHGLVIYKIENLEIHGGSLRYYIKYKNNNLKLHKSVYLQKQKEIKFGINKLTTYKKFAKRVMKSKILLKKIFNNIKFKKNKIIGYGATAKSTTILNYCNINNEQIDYFLDTTPSKQNKYTPGTKILIKKYKNKIDSNIKYVFLGAWNFKKEIFKKERNFIKKGGKFIIHTPFPKIL